MFRNVKIWQKLTLVGILAAIPLAALIGLYISKSNEQVARTRAEMAGLEYVTPLRNLLEKLPQHRAAASALLNGDASMRSTLMNLQAQVETAVGQVDAVDQQVGRQLGTVASWDAARVRWQDIKRRVQTLTPEESTRLHTELIAAVINHLRLVGDKTGLTTDPELDSFYLAQSVLYHMSWSAEYLGQLSSFTAGIAARQKLDAEEEAQIRFLNRQIGTSIDFLEKNLEAAFRYNEDVRQKLDGATSTALNSAGFLRGTTQRDILEAGSGRITVQPKVMLEAGAIATEKMFALFDLSVEQMKTLFQKRVARLNGEKNAQLGVALALLALAALMIVAIQRGIAQQVRSMSETFRQVSKGNYDARAEVYSEDELGIMAQATNEMLANTLSLIQSKDERDRIQSSILRLLDQVSGVAAGDLSRDAEVTAEVTGAIADSFNYMLSELRAVIGAVQRTADEVTRTAQQVQSSVEAMAAESQEQSGRIQVASGSIRAMTESIQQVAEAATAASKVAAEALESALAGGESVRRTIAGMQGIRGQVQETAKRMKRLGESSQEIGEIVQLISDISDRTSILALNASIQAATAGEAGKGFAVVAEEVERLAERATEATKRITTLIKSVQSDTTEAISAMEETTREVVNGSKVASEAGDRLTQIESVSKQIAGLVQGITESATRDAEGAEIVGRSVGSISDATERTARGTRLAAGEIRRLAALVTELSESLSRFRLPGHEHETHDTVAV